MIQSAQNVRADLTDRQAEILGFIVSCIEENGFSPTIREIGQQFGIGSPNGVMCHIRALRTKGYLHAEPRLARAFRPSVIARLGSRAPNQTDLQLLTAIAWFSLSRNRMPTVADLVGESGIDRQTVLAYLERLEEFGCVYWDTETDAICVLSPQPAQCEAKSVAVPQNQKPENV